MSTSGPKIVMVGGGSYNWCPTLLSDLMQTPELEGAEIVLLDPNLKAAKEVAAAARAMAKGFGRKYRVLPTRSEVSAFKDADFIVITISTGGLDMMAHDIAIPEKYGIFHPVGDTVGPGGWSRALRNIPVFADMAQRIEKYAPRALVLNYTNPMAALTGAFYVVSRLRAVGLCHGVFSAYHLLQKLFGVEERDLAVRFGGVNHFFWVLDFAVRGEPGYPLLKKRLGRRGIDEVLAEGETDAHGFHSRHALLDEFWRQYGYLGYPGDRHTCEFVPHVLAPTEASLKQFHIVRTTVEQRRQGHIRARQRALELARGKRQPSKRSRETAVDIMTASVTNRPFIDVANLPNTGQIDNLPRGAVVETLGLVDSFGFRSIATGAMPTVLQRLVEPHCAVQLMTLEAALIGDREMALQALMMDPLCSHLAPSDVRKMGLELMRATRDWLPQFG